ncbi:hypothetical protein ID866_9717 [Astraeus odoratus]|nr:hypothetical protein ID866_9717 [Astraeus odoratus]
MLLRPPMIDVVKKVSLLSGAQLTPSIRAPTVSIRAEAGKRKRISSQNFQRLARRISLSTQRKGGNMPETAAFDAQLTGHEITTSTQGPATVPCQYRVGRTLGSGSHSIVKEAIHVKTGQYYVCKVINKKLMEGREHMLRNEIAVLKRISSGHPNIVTLHDYFEASFGMLDGDAAELVRTIFQAVRYIHDCDIVHRNLKPEKLLFRSKPEKISEIMIVGFGLSRVMPDSKFNMLTEVCGTPGYMAPEIFKKTGYGKPVDVWAMGVITYFLLAGYTPFDRDTQKQEMEAIIAGDYRFEPEEYWASVSDIARDFVSTCLTVDPDARPTAEQALQHPWLIAEVPPYVEKDGQPADLLPHVRKEFDARKTFRKAVFSIIAVKRMATLASQLSPEHQKFRDELFKYNQESEKEVLEDMNIIHHNTEEPEQENTGELGGADNISLKKDPVAAAAEAYVMPGSSSELNKSNDGGKDVSEKLGGVTLTTAAKVS